MRMIARAAGALFGLLAFIAFAHAGAGTITTKDAGGVTRTFTVVTDGSGNFLASTVLCDATAGANCLTISGGAALVTGTGGTFPATQSGTWTVQPGNTANTTPWLTSPPTATTTQAKLTVAVTNTYQQALASSASRKGCTIQYVSVAGTKGFVFFGAAPADTTTSFQLTNGQSVSCQSPTVTATDAVQVTGTGTDIFIVSNQ